MATNKKKVAFRTKYTKRQVYLPTSSDI